MKRPRNSIISGVRRRKIEERQWRGNQRQAAAANGENVISA